MKLVEVNLKSSSGDFQSPNSSGDFQSPNSSGDFQSPNSSGDFQSPNSSGDFQSPNSSGDFQSPHSSSDVPIAIPSLRGGQAVTSFIKDFIHFPFTLYKDDPYWVPPLVSDLYKYFDVKKNPYYQHSEAKLFMVVDSCGDAGTTSTNRTPNSAPRKPKPAPLILGRISAQTNTQYNAFHNEKKGFFGFFECIDNQEVANLLLSAAENWLKSKGCDIISGPFNYTTNDICGLLVDGFESSPFVMMAHNPSYYATLLENYGMLKAMDLYAYYLESKTMPQFLDMVGKRSERSGQFSVRCLDKRHLKRDIETVFSIYQKAWERNWGFMPMTPAEFDHLVEALLPMVDPQLVFIAESEGKPAGFSVALPNYNVILKKIGGKITPLSLLKFLYYKNKLTSLRVITMGVIPEFQGKGIDSLFYYYTWKNGNAKGYYQGEFSWVLETNTMMNKIAQHLGAKVHKTYRIYERNLI